MANTKKKPVKPIAKKSITKTKTAKQPTKKAKTTKPKKVVELSYYMKRKLRLIAEAKEKAKKKPLKTKKEKSSKEGKIKVVKGTKVVKKAKPQSVKKPSFPPPTVVESNQLPKPIKRPKRSTKPPVDVELPIALVIKNIELVDIPDLEEEKPIATPAPGKNIYLNNRELLAEVKVSKLKGEMTNKLALMLQMLCTKYAKKGNFVNYSYNEDMQAYAMMMLVRTWSGFKPEVSTNAFAWYTQCVKNSFIQYLNQEKRQRVIRDELLVDQGMSPSYGFGERDDMDTHILEDEEDFHAHKNVADKLAQLPSEDVIEPDVIIVDDTDNKPDNQFTAY